MKLAIRNTKVGRGVFARECVRRGAVIMIMKGELLTDKEADELIESNKLRLDDPLQVAEDLYIILDRIPYFFNHSCEPNAGIRKQNELFALRAIESGDEITYDYATVVCAHSRWMMHCRCGSSLCRKEIRNFRSLPPALLATYKRSDALPSFIKKEIANGIY